VRRENSAGRQGREVLACGATRPGDLPLHCPAGNARRVGYATSMMPVVAPSIYTIGHSNHSLEHFLKLLRDSGTQAVADVRSPPYSRYCPHFSREPLQRALQVTAIPYVVLGEELGGRPKGAEFYDEEGHVRFSLVAKTDLFLAGLERLERGAAKQRIAVLCSEENPEHCHRHHLVGRALLNHGIKVEHIRGDGRIESAESPRRAVGAVQRQLRLDGLLDPFAPAANEEQEWKSPWKRTPSASPRTRPSSSLVR
jgi:hypothetical protein